MKYKCAMCGSVEDEDAGTCCGEMRDEMCDGCDQVVNQCECDKDDDWMDEEDDDL